MAIGAAVVAGCAAIPSPAGALSSSSPTMEAPNGSVVELLQTSGSGTRTRLSADGRSVTLRRRNVITGRRSSAIPVTLPRDGAVGLRGSLTRKNGPNHSIAISGNGRIVGIALIERSYPDNPVPGKFLFAGRAADCTKPGCAPRDVYNYIYDGSNGDKDRRVLKAGDYLLYLFADDAPVRVVLELEGAPGGTRRIKPSPSEAIDLGTPTTWFDSRDASTTWWAGSSFSGGDVGLVFSALVLKSEELADARVQNCQYRVVPPPPEPIAYGPHCYEAAFFAGAGYSLVLPSDYKPGVFIAFFLSAYHDQGTTVPSDEIGLGFYAQSPHPIETIAVNALTLTIR